MASLAPLSLGLWAAASSTAAPGLQLAVIVDSSVLDATGTLQPALLGELAAVQKSLESAPDGHEIAAVHCAAGRDGASSRIAADFGAATSQGSLLNHVASGGSAARGCRVNADTISAAVLGLSWRPAAQRRVLIITRESAAVPAGKRTFEEVTSDAEHQGIVLHALSLCSDSGEQALSKLMRGLRAFMGVPTADHNSVVSHMRQGALRTGGSYHVSVQVPKMAQPWPPRAKIRVTYRGRDLRRLELTDLERLMNEPSSEWMQEGLRQEIRYRAGQITPEKERTKLRQALSLEQLYGPQIRGRQDVLDALASGRLRPGEVTQVALPKFLRGHALEPLLDPVWDFVHARATVERIITSIAVGRASGGTVPPLAGLALGEALLSPPRCAPSKR